MTAAAPVASAGPPRRLRRYWPQVVFAAAVVVHLALLSSVTTHWLSPLFHDTDSARHAIDFYSIYEAGASLLAGRSLYYLDWLPYAVPYAAPFRYMPFVAYAIALPLNILPPERAYWVWISLVEYMVIFNAWFTFRLARGATWGWVAAAMWLTPTPLYEELYLGQWSILMATLTLLAVAALMRERPWQAALPWTLSIVVKTNTAILAPLLLRRGYWRVMVFAAVAVVVLNLPYLLVRPEEFGRFIDRNFYEYFGEQNRRDAFSTADLGLMQLVRTMWLWWLPSSSGAPQWLIIAIGVSVIGVSAWATFRGREADVVLLAALWLSVYFLVYTDVWSHHYMMLVPALALLVIHRPDMRLLALVVFAAIALPTPYWLFERFLNDFPGERAFGVAFESYWPRWAGIIYHATKPVPVLWLWGSIAYALIAAPSAATDPADRAAAFVPERLGEAP